MKQLTENQLFKKILHAHIYTENGGWNLENYKYLLTEFKGKSIKYSKLKETELYDMGYPHHLFIKDNYQKEVDQIKRFIKSDIIKNKIELRLLERAIKYNLQFVKICNRILEENGITETVKNQIHIEYKNIK